ncbi:MAG: shikimate dehydrogenase [Lachnospiraceae bacterium]
MNQIDAKTRMACFIAQPARHSGSPAIYNAAFSKLGLNYCYLSFEISPENLAEAINSIKVLDMLGANISMPHKGAAVSYMDTLSPSASMVGAVNMILNRDGVLEGYNTDGEGFVANLRDHGVSVEGKTITLVGVGGAASAIAAQLALDGTKQLQIFNKRDSFWDNGEELVKRIAEKTDCKVSLQDIDDRKAFHKAVRNSNILANATSLGMGKLKDLSIVGDDPGLLRPDLVVADVVYHPSETVLLKLAKEAGCVSIGGIGMLIGQAAANFKIYTGQEMPVEYVKEVMGVNE